MEKITFYSWLIKRRGDDSVIGDLAKDVFNDSNYPKLESNKKQIKEYLEKSNYCSGRYDYRFDKKFRDKVILAFNNAWKLWESHCEAKK